MSDYLFSGLKVLDVGTAIAGPVAATILADFGADVIKIEEPDQGDMLRLFSYIPTTPDAGNDYFWQMDARNKRSLTLNLKDKRAIEVLHKLIRECDVYITNQPFPVRRSLGLEYHDLKPLNPGMIYASLTAAGESGPDKDTKGFDLVAYWGRSGLMDLVRSTDSTPSQALPGMGDHPTAVSLYASIVTALLHRERTGEGSMVHTSLLANGIWSAASIAQGGLAGGDLDAYRESNRIPGVMGRVYRTRDKRYLQLTMVRTEQNVTDLLLALGVPDLFSDEHLATPEGRLAHRAALSDVFQDILARKDADEWLRIFAQGNVPVKKVATIDEAILDEQLLVNDMVVKPEDDACGIPLIINHPVKVDGVKQVGPLRAPEIGEHSRQILLELGYMDEEIRALREEGAV